MIEINNKTKVKIDERLIKKTAEKFLKKFRVKKDVSIAFIDNKKMKELNSIYRKKNKTTDVLSFPNQTTPNPSLSKEGGSNILPTNKGELEGVIDNFLGEILINPNQIKKQARGNKNSFNEELVFILVHGLLHLIGHNDNTEKDRLKMMKLGENFIKSI